MGMAMYNNSDSTATVDPFISLFYGCTVHYNNRSSLDYERERYMEHLLASLAERLEKLQRYWWRQQEVKPQEVRSSAQDCARIGRMWFAVFKIANYLSRSQMRREKRRLFVQSISGEPAWVS